MIAPRGRLFALSVVVSVLFCFAHPCLPADNAGTEPGKTDAAKIAVPSLEKAMPMVKTENVKKVGKTLSKRVHGTERIVSSYIGTWAGKRIVGPLSMVTIITFLILVAVVIVIERVLRVIIWAVRGRLSRKETVPSWTSVVLEALTKPLSLFVLAWGIYLALAPLLEDFRGYDGTNTVVDTISWAVGILGTIAILWFIYRLAQAVVAKLERWAETTAGGLDDMLVRLFGTTARVLILLIGGLFILQNVTGVEIGPLIASLGLGGLAFALAAKDFIANLFGTVTIMLDKPFAVGDRVKISNFDGSVENVGYRSTRLRTLDGHIVSIPNQTVMNASLENVSERPFLKWSTNLTLTYDTPPEKIERGVRIMHEILRDHEGQMKDQPPRIYFNALNDWNLSISVTTWYAPADWWPYQAWIQRTCLEILRRFEQEGLEFAFPTQTIYLADDEKRRLKLELIRGEEIAA